MARSIPALTAEATLAAAFQDDPLFAWVLPDPARRGRALPRLFAGVVRRCRILGGVVDVERGGGVATWVPADRIAMPLPDLLRHGLVWTPLWIGLAGTRRLTASDEVSDALVSRHVAPGDAYLWCLGADPARRGRGLGRRAVEECLDQVREAGARRLLLATQNPRNVPLYRHLGFELVDEAVVPGSPLTTWVFRREVPAGAGSSRAV